MASDAVVGVELDLAAPARALGEGGDALESMGRRSALRLRAWPSDAIITRTERIDLLSSSRSFLFFVRVLPARLCLGFMMLPLRFATPLRFLLGHAEPSGQPGNIRIQRRLDVVPMRSVATFGS